MKKILLIISLVTAINAQAQYYWNFETATFTSSNNATPAITISPITLHNNNGSTTLLTDGASSGYFGASGGKAAAASSKEGGLDKNNSTYFEVTLTPSPGNSIVLSGISFGSKSSGIGPTNWSLRTSSITSSNGAYGEDFGAGTLNTSNWEEESAVFSLVGFADEAITLRIYGFNFTTPPTANEVNWLIDDLKLHTDIQTLPIKLKSFEAQELISAISLKWKTSSEENSSDFEILRSNDGKIFKSIGNVLSAGTSKVEKSYSFTDFSPLAGVNYYQLLQRDKDGKSSKSKIISSNFNAPATNIQLIPSSNSIKLVIYSPVETEGRFTLSNLSGATLANRSVKLEKGNNTFTLQNEVASSILIASWKSSTESVSKKFFVQ